LASPEAAPAAAAVPALLRRRAGLSDRMALQCACAAAGAGPLPSVFASRHGQIARSVQLLRALAEGTPSSPMDFSVSVHNATAGLFSMARGDRSGAAALAAGRESFSAGLLESLGLLAEGAPKALLVFHDEEPPAPLETAWNREPSGFALALRVESGASETLEISLTQAEVGAPENPEPQALSFLKVLAGGEESARWCAGGRLWTWRRIS
jgi:hypothetical protein